MGTVIRSSISSSNPYYISKHRFLELKHFCLQYPEWRLKAYGALRIPSMPINCLSCTNWSDSVSSSAIRREMYLRCMEIVEQTAIKAAPDIYQYLLKCTTEGVSYTYLKTYDELPCSKDYFYDRYRKFFFLLDKVRENV